MTTSEEVYDTLKAAASSADPGLVFVGKILLNEQVPKTSRRRAFFLAPQGETRADGMVTRFQGYRWVTETYLVRLTHTFKGKRQDTARALAYDDAKLVWNAIELDPTLVSLSPQCVVETRAGPALSPSGDFIITDLSVAIRYQVAEVPGTVPKYLAQLEEWSLFDPGSAVVSVVDDDAGSTVTYNSSTSDVWFYRLLKTDLGASPVAARPVRSFGLIDPLTVDSALFDAGMWLMYGTANGVPSSAPNFAVAGVRTQGTVGEWRNAREASDVAASTAGSNQLSGRASVPTSLLSLDGDVATLQSAIIDAAGNFAARASIATNDKQAGTIYEVLKMQRTAGAAGVIKVALKTWVPSQPAFGFAS